MWRAWTFLVSHLDKGRPWQEAVRGEGMVRFPAWSGALFPVLPALAQLPTQPPTCYHLATGVADTQTQSFPALPVALRQTISAPVMLRGGRELSAQRSLVATCGHGDALNLKPATGQMAEQKYWDELLCGLRSALSDTDGGEKEKGQDWT